MYVYLTDKEENKKTTEAELIDWDMENIESAIFKADFKGPITFKVSKADTENGLISFTWTYKYRVAEDGKIIIYYD